MTEQEIRDWLLRYAWMGTPTERRHEVDCIMAQGEWQHLSAQAEHYLAQASGEEADAPSEAQGFALSALYECHDGPHQPTCPRFTEAPTRVHGLPTERKQP